MIKEPMKITVSRYIERKGLGEEIRQCRKKSDKTITQLSSEAGISVAYWNRIEKENVAVALPIETLRAIERALGVDFGVSIDD